MHQEMNSEAASSSSQLRVAVPPKRERESRREGSKEQNHARSRWDEIRAGDDWKGAMLTIEEDKDMWRKLFEDCNKKQGEEIERLR